VCERERERKRERQTEKRREKREWGESNITVEKPSRHHLNKVNTEILDLLK